MPGNASLLGWAMSSLTLKSKPSEQAPVALESSLLAGFCNIHFWSSPNFCYCHHLWFFNLIRCGQLTTRGVLPALATFWILFQDRNLVSMMAQTKVSLDWIYGFLEEEKLQEDATIVLSRGIINMAISLCIKLGINLSLFEACELDSLIIPNELYMLLLSYY